MGSTATVSNKMAHTAHRNVLVSLEVCLVAVQQLLRFWATASKDKEVPPLGSYECDTAVVLLTGSTDVEAK